MPIFNFKPTANQVLNTTSSPTFNNATLTGTLTENNLQNFNYFEDFVSPITTFGLLQGFQNGTGAGIAGSDTWRTSGTSNRIGVIGIQTGTTTSGYAVIYSNPHCFYFGNGTLSLECELILPVLSDGSNTYKLKIGFTKNAFFLFSGADSYGAYFTYDSTSSPKWLMNTVSNFVSTQTATTVDVTNSGTEMTKLKIISSTAGVVDFYINDVQTGSINTNVPTNAYNNQTGVVMGIYKSAGTSTRYMYLDWVRIQCLNTGTRI